MDLVIIVSVINPVEKPLSYYPVRSVFNKSQRYEQTLKTIDSIRNKIPNSQICLLECSLLDEEMTETLKKKVDLFFNYQDNEVVRKVVESPFKGAGEVKALIQFITTHDISIYSNLYKISGRYWLTDKYEHQNFDFDENVFNVRGPSFSTVFYKINQKYYDQYKEVLLEALKLTLTGRGGVENVIYNLFHSKKIKFIPTPSIGYEGYVFDGTYISY